jgi:hypothetical protein
LKVLRELRGLRGDDNKQFTVKQREAQILCVQRLFQGRRSRKKRSKRTPTLNLKSYLGGGHNTKAVQMLESTGLAQPSLASVFEKFPLHTEEPSMRLVRKDIECITVSETREAAEHVKSVTSSGPDGIQHRVLIDIVKSLDDGAVLVTNALNTILENLHMLGAQSILDLTEVKLVCLKKNEEDFRPICVANSLFRLFSAILVRRSKKALNKALDAQDLSMRPSGQSIMITALQELARRGFSMIKSDRKNAFNSLRMESAQKHFKEAGLDELEFLASSLRSHTVVVDEDNEFYAASVPQGSSLGPAAMAITTNAAFKGIRSKEVSKEDSLALALAFYDDVVTAGGSMQVALNTLNEVNAALSAENLVEELSKRKTYGPDSTEALKVLGAYVGTDEQMMEALQQPVKEVVDLIKEFARHVGEMPFEDAAIRQTAIRALRLNLLTKLIYLIQHHPSHIVENVVEALDDEVLRQFATILGLSWNEAKERETQIRLPISKGGFGLTSLKAVAHLQRIGTLIRALPGVRALLERVGVSDGLVIPELDELIGETLNNLASTDKHEVLKTDLKRVKKWNAGEENIENADFSLSIQRRLTEIHYDDELSGWVSSFSEDDLALREIVNSITAPESGRPLSVTTFFMPNQLTDRQFILWARRRLLLPFTDGNVQCCVKHKVIDAHLEHGLKCGSEGLGRGKMHEYVKWGLYSVAQKLVAATSEKVEVEPTITSWRKPAVASTKKQTAAVATIAPRGDVILSSYLNRGSTLIDVRHCAMQVPRKDKDLGLTVLEGEKAKEKYYAENFDLPKTVKFVPFVVDSFGRWGDKAKAFVHLQCLKAAGGSELLFNSHYGKAMDSISTAHARGIGNVMHECLTRCLSDADFIYVCNHSGQLRRTFAAEHDQLSQQC